MDGWQEKNHPRGDGKEFYRNQDFVNRTALLELLSLEREKPDDQKKSGRQRVVVVD